MTMKGMGYGLVASLLVLSSSCGSGSEVDPTLIKYDTTPGEDAGSVQDSRGVDGAGDAPAVPDGAAEVDPFPDGFGPDGGGSCGPPPYPFGCGCEGNSDCLSGYCVEGPQGFVCTQTCLEDCPDDWFCKGVSGLGPDLVFVCMPKTKKLCYPCETDGQCGGGRCVELDDGRFCTFECGDLDPCPSTFSCVPKDEDSGVDVCVPDSGSCECISGAEGQLRPCSLENEFGTCYGYETCAPGAGWQDCSAVPAAPEICDGKDNDCNGAIDEGIPESQPCEKSSEFGTCAGTETCMGPLGWVCQALQPTEELCDYVDNDCDGAVDEGYAEDGKYVLDDHCGACNNACLEAFSNATGTCDDAYATPKCVVDQCDEGYYAISPFQCVIPEDTDCLPCNNDGDCMGGWCQAVDGQQRCVNPCVEEADCLNFTACIATDDLGPVCLPPSGSCECHALAAGAKRSCVVENAIGACYGFETCDPLQGWGACSAVPANPEVCDGADNDCNGIIDDGIAPTEPCEIANEYGTCAGIASCMGAAGWVCQAQEPAAELCDYQDNDCDGAIDELYKYAGKYVSEEHCGACNKSCAAGLPHASAVCADALNPPTCVVDACDEGYFQLNEFQCILPPPVQCQPCEDDGDCYFEHCVAMGDGSFCLDGCDGEACGPDAACLDLAPWGPVCVPLTGSCGCSPATDGAKRPCSAGNDVGICFGFETCSGDSGWGACSALTPAAEVCDGIDNDCNGFIDDALPQTQPCEVSNGFGTCAGAASCAGQTGWACQAPVPSAEVCDGLDNDCNDGVDEDFKIAGKYAYDAHCGVCNNTCDGAIPNATAVCDGSYPIPKCVVAVCDDGFYPVSPSTCFPVEEAMCGPCQSDADCPTPGDLCLPQDGGKFCGRDCAAGNLYGTPPGDCPDGFTCMDLDGDAAQCQPLSGSCTCLDINDGDTRTCFEQNTAGICYGQQTCDPGVGWSDCTAKVPSTEICNGADDDCNLAVDDVPGRGAPCENENGAGICPGVMDCVEGDAALVCAGQLPQAELCNGIDDDCDGAIDETFDGLFDPCSDGEGACERFGFVKCTPGGAGTYCTANAAAPGDEICNGVDDDCDQGVDEDFPDKGTVCTVGVGLCQTSGVKLCTPDGAGTACSVAPGQPVDELCNGVDDDCDQSVDEDFPDKGTVCTVGTGVCKDTGLMLCTPGGAGTACSVEPGDPGSELCNGLDDDCDGLVDEDFPDKGSVCIVGQGVCQTSGVRLCAPGGGGTVCSVEPGEAGDELCNGLDDDCDGLIDEDFPDKGTVCVLGLGICQASGTKICNQAGTATACSATPGDSGVEVCNGLDDDCDGATDEGPLWTNKGGACVVSQGVCAAVGVVICDPGDPAAPALCNAVAGTPKAELCNGLDDDCDGPIDEGIASAPACLEQDGVCADSTQTCGGASGWIACTSGNYGADYETVEFSCDGLDNDCDGFVDNDLPELPCAKTKGVCAGSVKLCVDDAWAPCDATQYGDDYQADEVTCDLLDNDCDGATDEGWTIGGAYVLDAACGNCFTDCTVLYALPQATGFCSTAGPTPKCDFLCDDGWYDLNEVPDDGCEFQLDPDGIYVAANGNDTSLCGDGPFGVGQFGPCETITWGLARAQAAGADRVLVAAGSYQEAVALVNGVDLQGGYNPINWGRNISGNLTQITAPSGAGHRKTVTATGIVSPTLFEGFVVSGATAYTPGSNSYALYVSGGNGALVISQNTLFGGDGAPGSSGSAGAEGVDGTDGAGGVKAFDTGSSNCSNTSQGGSGGARSCGGTNVSGGKGGNAVCVPDQGIQKSGKNGAAGSGTGGGAAGAGGWDGGTRWGSGEYCGLCHLPSESMGGANGANGQVGTNGNAGAGCQSVTGGVSGGEWKGSTAGAGNAAGHGGGGGGAGAGGGGEAMDSGCNEDLGGTGGGGGSGACGGTAGTGGFAGGGSFAIFVHGTSAPPSISGNIIHRGNGGVGGVGGPGGAGGIGGDGANGGPEATGYNDFCTGSGGKGGQGGNGGHGGGGGGGCGGVSFGIWGTSLGGSPGWADDNTFLGGGSGGAGGAGGSSLGSSGATGSSGDDGDVHL